MERRRHSLTTYLNCFYKYFKIYYVNKHSPVVLVLYSCSADSEWVELWLLSVDCWRDWMWRCRFSRANFDDDFFSLLPISSSPLCWPSAVTKGNFAIHKASYPLIAKANSHARSECFQIWWLDGKFSRRACELAFAITGSLRLLYPLIAKDNS